MVNIMKEFLDAYNKSEQITEKPLAPFIGCPTLLPLAVREELIYRYQFLEESIEFLATLYRLTPKALTEWLEESDTKPQPLDTDEDLAAFETHVNATYKSLRIRMSGLVALNTAKAWHSLASTEDNLLATLLEASEKVRKAEFADAKVLASLVSSHNKLVDRHTLIQNAIDIPADRDAKGFIDSITKTLKELFDDIDGTSYRLPSDET